MRRAGRAMLAERFARALEGLSPRLPLAVAVSGGSDSLALLHLVSDWLGPERRGGASVLTVDHGLRAGASAEAEAVVREAHRLGLSAHCLSWEGAKPATGLQAAARAARYRLLGAWCRGHAHGDLLLAHTEDDQAETFLMRLARGGALDALAGMAALAPVPGAADIRLLRPLLGVSRAELRAFLAGRGLAWAEDPSNADLRFERVRVRQLLDRLEAGGLSRKAIAESARHLARARAALEAAAEACLARVLRLAPEGYAVLDRAALAEVPEEIAMRTLARALGLVTGAAPRPRLAAVERVAAMLRSPAGGAATLAGCRIRIRGASTLIIRELRGLEAAHALSPGETRIWDRRFRVALAAGPRGAEVGALGALGLAAIRMRLAPEVLARIPEPVRASLPALRRAGVVLAVPHLAFARTEGAGFAAEFLTPRADCDILWRS